MTSKDEDALRRLIAEGADVNAQCKSELPLWNACRRRNPSFAEILIDAGADVNAFDTAERCALVTASMNGNLEIVQTLLKAGAEINMAPAGQTCLYAAAIKGWPDLVAFLSLRGASRTAHMRAGDADLDAELPELLQRELQDMRLIAASSGGQLPSYIRPDMIVGLEQTIHWLQISRGWHQPLHHLELLDQSGAPYYAPHTRDLLRDGADVHARDLQTPGAPSPLERARELYALAKEHGEELPVSSSATLVLLAASPWSPASHELFPKAARERAWLLLQPGSRLAKRVRPDRPVAFTDVWLAFVMPLAISRHWV